MDLAELGPRSIEDCFRTDAVDPGRLTNPGPEIVAFVDLKLSLTSDSLHGSTNFVLLEHSYSFHTLFDTDEGGADIK